MPPSPPTLLLLALPLPLVLLIYNLALPLVLLVLLPASVLKMRKRGGYGAKFWQRFGFFGPETAQRLAAAGGHCRWMHAVSVGEVNVARKLIAELLRHEPEIPVVLSVTTSTGYAVAVEKAPAQLTVIYSPVDLPWVAGAVVRRIRPLQFILVEAEVWPNLVHCLRRRKVPVVLVNARLSVRSGRRYRSFRALAGPVFAMLDRVLVQEPEDQARWTDIGARPGTVEVTGSIKFDQEGQPPPSRERMEEFRLLLRQAFGGVVPRVVLAASTHAGEEAAVARIWREIQPDFPEARLLIAPRHAERRAVVEAEVKTAGFRVLLRSRLVAGSSGTGTGTDSAAAAGLASGSAAGAPKGTGALLSGEAAAPPAGIPTALIVDSTGELRDWQALSEVVIIGKSFLAHGGQNPAEAMAAGIPVLTGPHMENFSGLMKLLQSADGIRQLPDLAALPAALRRILGDPLSAKEEAARGRAVLNRHAGATCRTAAALKLSKLPSCEDSPPGTSAAG